MRLAIVLLLAAAGCSSDRSVELAGYWVWKEVVDNGQVTLTITDADMEWKIGSSGWPGCPTGVSCTRHGIQLLYLDGDRLHFMHRVVTGSDTQLYGAYTADDGLVTVEQEQQYSCAHPRDPSTYRVAVTRLARERRVGDELWMTALAASDPGVDATTWTVYRRTTKEDAHGKYDHPFCGEAREGGTCHCLCPSQDVLADHACGA